jgi:hypothetical protein
LVEVKRLRFDSAFSHAPTPADLESETSLPGPASVQETREPRHAQTKRSASLSFVFMHDPDTDIPHDFPQQDLPELLTTSELP